MSKLLEDPALLVGLIRSALILAVSFGVALTQVQVDSLLLFTGSLLAVLSLVLTQVTRLSTTSTAHPVLTAGTTVEVVTPAGEPNRLKVV